MQNTKVEKLEISDVGLEILKIEEEKKHDVGLEILKYRIQK